jgi:transposase
MWTPTTRKQHSRKTCRYQTDMTDEEWHVIEPYLPATNVTGRPRAWPMREIINGIFYVMRAGCPWRLLPSDLPPWSTIYRWFAKFRDVDLSGGKRKAPLRRDGIRPTRGRKEYGR